MKIVLAQKIIPEVSEFLILIYELYVKDENIFLLFNVKRNLNGPNLENVD